MIFLVVVFDNKKATLKTIGASLLINRLYTIGKKSCTNLKSVSHQE